METVPDSRSRQFFFWSPVHHLTSDVLNVFSRSPTYAWGIDSHTIGFHYRYDLGHVHYLRPHLRYYIQSAAGFFTTALVDGRPLPQYVSSDYRLGVFETQTIGLKYAMRTGETSAFSVRADLIRQTPKEVATPSGHQAN